MAPSFSLIVLEDVLIDAQRGNVATMPSRCGLPYVVLCIQTPDDFLRHDSVKQAGRFASAYLKARHRYRVIPGR